MDLEAIMRRKTVCELAGIEAQQFKTLRRRAQLPFPDTFVGSVEDERAETSGQGTFEVGHAVLLDAQAKLSRHGGLSNERSAQILRNVYSDSVRWLGDSYAWLRLGAVEPVYFAQPTEFEDGQLIDVPRFLGSLDGFCNWIARLQSPIAHVVSVNLSVSVTQVRDRAHRRGIALPLDERTD